MKNIALYLMGGLGNQLFQCLHAIKLKEEGNSVRLLADWFTKPKPPGTTFRELCIHKLGDIDLPITFTADLLEQGHIISPHGFGPEPYNEKLIEFKWGYFQNALDLPSSERLVKFYSSLPINKKFSDLKTMHIRLGDYIKLGWALPKEYYQNIFKNNPKINFVIFCENEAETENFLHDLVCKNYIFANEVDPSLGKDAVSDFIAMSSSSELFGSNSTFAYLAGLNVGFRGGLYMSPNNNYWEWFDQERHKTGKSLLDYSFIKKMGC
jgi:hypothetical protein